MSGSKITSMTSAQMRAARERGESRTDWERVRREANQEPGAAEENRSIGEAIARKRGRPVVGEPKAAISLRLPVSVLEHWKATGPGWQTRMAELLAKRAP
ncbi:BrnA antitoxin family protein [Paraburkholderia sp. A1RO-5L]|uniref:BrnA antitoxin family protein n=1 Tax=unclassified Paraburkholderia TaxID=2615204 RepID=UPI003B7EB961